MRKQDEVRIAAEQMSTALQKEFARYNCYAYPKVSRTASDAGVAGWQAYLDPYAAFDRDLEGAWSISSYWRFVADPATGEAVLLESSLGVNVENWPTDLLGDTPDDRKCFVRYDYDARDSPRRHLNVLQPGAISDNLHWRISAPGESEQWDYLALIETVLNGKWWEELHRRGGWPKS